MGSEDVMSPEHRTEPLSRRLVERAIRTSVKRYAKGFTEAAETLAALRLRYPDVGEPLAAYQCHGRTEVVLLASGILFVTPYPRVIPWDLLGTPSSSEQNEHLNRIRFDAHDAEFSVMEGDFHQVCPLFYHLARWLREGRTW